MQTPSSQQKFLLICAFLVPFAYFGAQLLAAPYFPDYSIFTTSASDLGSDRSSRPYILNTGAFLTGALALLGSVGLALSLPRFGASRVAAFLSALSLASAGLAALWAGLHPLPHPQHDPGALGAGMFLAPFVAVWAGWRIHDGNTIRIVLLSNAAAFIGFGTIMSGATGIDLSAYGGLVQKLLALTSFAPGSVLAGAALLRARRLARAG
jgi:hypothetical membrane protein